MRLASERIRSMTRGMPRPEALQTVIDFYLSENHLQHPNAGCVVAALGTEIARFPRPMKVAVAKALDRYADELEYLMPGATRDRRKAAFRVLFSSMAGCMMAARVHSNKASQRELLAGGRAFFTAAFCHDSSASLLKGLP